MWSLDEEMRKINKYFLFLCLKSLSNTPIPHYILFPSFRKRINIPVSPPALSKQTTTAGHTFN